jgi:multiple sugar transport system ATP-binding protein
VFLFDEPLSNLDARLRLEARTFLKQLQKSLGVTTVFVTHDQAEALAMADRMAVMESGRIRQIGTPREVVQRPANTFVANFIGATPMNLLDAQVVGGRLELGGFSLPVPEGFQPVQEGDKVVYGVRPEYVTATPAADGRRAAGDGPVDGSVVGTVSAVENLGVHVLVTLDVGEQSLRAVIPEADEPDLGDALTVTPVPGRVLLYRADGDGELIGS